MTAKIENRKSDFNDVGMRNDVRNIVPYIITIKYYSVTTSLQPEHLHDHLKFGNYMSQNMIYKPFLPQ